MSEQVVLRTNQEIYEGLADSARTLMNTFTLKDCPVCSTNEYVSPMAMIALNNDVIAILEAKFLVYKGCTFGHGPEYNFKCRKCTNKF